MKFLSWRGAASIALLFTSMLMSSCENSTGVGFSVDVPSNYGSMELGMPTTNWVGGPFW
jgi:hypothetical protein